MWPIVTSFGLILINLVACFALKIRWHGVAMPNMPLSQISHYSFIPCSWASAVQCRQTEREEWDYGSPITGAWKDPTCHISITMNPDLNSDLCLGRLNAWLLSPYASIHFLLEATKAPLSLVLLQMDNQWRGVHNSHCLLAQPHFCHSEEGLIEWFSPLQCDVNTTILWLIIFGKISAIYCM